MSYSIGCRHCSDPALLWLWRRLAAAALIPPLALELPYGSRAVKKKKKEGRKKERKRERKKNGVNLQGLNYKTDENQEAMAPEYHRGREELCKWHNIILEQTMPFLPLESHPLKEERQ